MRYGDEDLTNVVVMGMMAAITVAEPYEAIRDRIEMARTLGGTKEDGASSPSVLLHCMARFAFPGQPEQAALVETAFAADHVIALYRVPPGGLNVE